MRNVAIVLAGGVGRRIGQEIPKQLIEIAGRPIIEYSIRAFQDAEEIDEIIVLMAPGFTDRVPRPSKVTRVLEGGASRTETTTRAITALGEPAEDVWVLLHDAARPLVDQRIIADCVAAQSACDALTVAIPSSDTMLVADGDVVASPFVPLDRVRLRRVQTPQCFRLSIIRKAYELAAEDPSFTGQTDDCGVVLRYLPDLPVHVVPGDERNIKVTHPVDLAIAETLLPRPQDSA